MDDPTERLEAILSSEAQTADADSQPQEARLLRHLADTVAGMTPAERTWAQQASDEELQSFAKAIRLGCAPTD